MPYNTKAPGLIQTSFTNISSKVPIQKEISPLTRKTPPPRHQNPLFSHKDPHNWLIIVSVGSQKELDTFPVSVLAVCSSGEAAQRCLRCIWELQTYRVSSRLFKTAEYGSIDSLCGRRMNAWSDPITAVLPVFVGTFSIEADSYKRFAKNIPIQRFSAIHHDYHLRLTLYPILP